MKISKETVTALKNMAVINSNLYIKKGSKLATKSPSNALLAEVVVDEEFDRDFGIYDLAQFLGLLSLYEEPEVIFDDRTATVKQGNATTVFYAADPAILTYPQKELKFPTVDIEFELPAAELAKVIKTAGILGCDSVSFEGAGGKLFLIASDPTVESSNKFKLELGETTSEFKAFMKIDNLKLLANDYTVSISTKKICRLQTADQKVTYYVALESTSSF